MSSLDFFKYMSFKFQHIIENYCEKGILSDEEVDFLEREHLKTISMISEQRVAPLKASLRICEACNLEPGSFWIMCNASILDKVRPVKTGKQRAHKLFDSLSQYKYILRNA